VRNFVTISPSIRTNSARVLYSLWNSGIEIADRYIKTFRCGLVEDAWDPPEIDMKRFQAKLVEIRDDLYANSKAVGVTRGLSVAANQSERPLWNQPSINGSTGVLQKAATSWTKAGAQALLNVKRRAEWRFASLTRDTPSLAQQPLNSPAFYGLELKVNWLIVTYLSRLYELAESDIGGGA